MKIRSEDTIAAIATPAGEGAIAIVRMSGPDSLTIADRIFHGKIRLGNADGYTVHYGELRDSADHIVDFVLSTVFRKPRSYTGEDSVEFSCHGGILVTNLVLAAILQAGARQADPGEFTKRAYLNSKLDLSQAEAVADLIAARSRKAYDISLGQLKGKLSSALTPLRKSILEACSLLELELDFSSDNVPLVPKEQIHQILGKVEAQISALLKTYDIGKAYRDGVSVVLAGKPNVGKSSIFNRILMEERAIVAPSPGTTRDFIEESVVIEGILFRIVDTAGLGSSSDPVEMSGVLRATNLLRESDIVLEVLDATESVDSQHEKPTREESMAKAVRVYNKIDLIDSAQFEMLKTPNGSGDSCVFVSALSGAGIDDLRKAMVRSVVGNGSNSEEGLRVTSLRHKLALGSCLESIKRAKSSNLAGESNEFVSFELRQAVESLSVIVGEITTDDILDSVFGKFCIGK